MRDLIVFAEDYNGLPSSTQHLINGLAIDRKVIWVNSIGLRQPSLTLKDIKRVVRKCLCWRMTHRDSDNSDYQTERQNRAIQPINLITIPAPASSLARAIAKWLMVKQLLPVIKKRGLQRPILWTSLPTTADLCGHLGESAVVYYCGDDFSSLAGVDHKTVAMHEAKLVDDAHLILTASDVLTTKFPAAKTISLPHGVDVELFSTPTVQASELDTLRADNNRPIAGFYGSISSWLDYQLISDVCTTLTDWDFIFIGPMELNQNPLPQLKNVYYLGTRQHDKLASYSQHWDVSLLPFKRTPQIESCNPLKLLEYMATGRPIVTTPFPALHPYLEHVHCAQNSIEFIHALLKAKSSSPIPNHLIVDHSWQQRSKSLSLLMEQL